MPLVRVKQQKHCFSTLPYVETIYKDHVVGINMFIYHLFAMIVTIPFRVMCCWTCYASVKSRVAGYTSAIELFTLLTDDENALEQDHWAQLTHQHTKKKGIACHCFHLIIDIARCVSYVFSLFLVRGTSNKRSQKIFESLPGTVQPRHRLDVVASPQKFPSFWGSTGWVAGVGSWVVGRTKNNRSSWMV